VRAQFEYTINQVREFLPLARTVLIKMGTQGIAPTLLYPVPSAEEHAFLSKIIHSVRDYYPLWQVCAFAINRFCN
jgi:battenin